MGTGGIDSPFIGYCAIMDIRKSNTLLYALALLVLFFLSSTKATASKFDRLQSEYNSLIKHAINEKIRLGAVKKVAGIDALYDLVMLHENQHPDVSLTLIVGNRFTILENSNHPKSITLVKKTLHYGYSELSYQLIHDFENEFNDYGVAWVTLELARYNLAQKNYKAVDNLLRDSRFSSHLKPDQLADSKLIHATALQYLKDHRSAIKIYENTEADGVLKKTILLNLSTSYIKQNWWTDAKLSIDQALAIASYSDLDNRLYTLLGYSQIQFGFYRDARESFRKVDLDSYYVNKALLGLGVAALYQKEFASALQAFHRLKNKDDIDMSVVEAHLLFAFTLRQLNMINESELAYQAAVDYFSKILNSDEKKFYRKSNQTDRTIALLIRMQRVIEEFMGSDKDRLANMRLTSIRDHIVNTKAEVSENLYQQERHDIRSYFNQAKFGLASLYERN